MSEPSFFHQGKLKTILTIACCIFHQYNIKKIQIGQQGQFIKAKNRYSDKQKKELLDLLNKLCCRIAISKDKTDRMGTNKRTSYINLKIHWSTSQ